jgi:purine nucleosidase
MPQVMIVDTDTASDDAVALIMALRARDVTVEAVTVVAGNVGLPQASRNARYTVELCGAHVPMTHMSIIFLKVFLDLIN